MLNAGVRYQIDQSQIGLRVGVVECVFSISGDAYLHFGGSSKFSSRRPWFYRIRIQYLRCESDSAIDKYVVLNNQPGRDTSLSEKVGIEMSV